MNKSENERSSVISSAVKCLSLFRDEVVAENTSSSDFGITDLVQQERPVSFYLTVPPSDLSRTRPLVRLLIQQIGRRLTESLHIEDGRGLAPTRHRLLLLMDEFPALGRLEFFETQLAFLAGYGVQAFLIIQDLSQLYATYGRNESIVSSCGIRVAFAPNRIETARLLSDMAGTMTVHRRRRIYSGHRLSPWLSHVMASEEESQRALLTPDEALRLPENVTLVFRSGHRPIYAEKVRYYADPRLRERARIPAPKVSDRIPKDAETPRLITPWGVEDLRIGVPVKPFSMTIPHEEAVEPARRVGGNGPIAPPRSSLTETEDLLK
jgi:type IV secretion system protein VirD4